MKKKVGVVTPEECNEIRSLFERRNGLNEMVKINAEGTTIMMVTHDLKVASKSSRILYIEDGNIKGELELGKFTDNDNARERERKANRWLEDMGW